MDHIASCCFFGITMLSTGWTLLKSSGLSRRLLLTSSSIKLQRMSSEGASVRHQNRVWASLQFDGQCSLNRPTASEWTLHSARSFHPRATAALAVPKEQRDYLGGWSSQGSDSNTRVAGRRITNLQKLVNIAWQGSSEDRSQWPKQPNISTSATSCAPKATPLKTEQSVSKDWNDQSHRDHTRNSKG